MCEFKPGDEVVCVDIVPKPGRVLTGLVKGATYTIGRIGPSDNPDYRHEIVVFLVDARNDAGGAWSFDTGYSPSRFRKVQRRDLSAWLKTSIGNTDKLDKRAPAKEAV